MANLINTNGQYGQQTFGFDNNEMNDKIHQSQQAVANSINSNPMMNIMGEDTFSPKTLTQVAGITVPLVATDRFLNSKMGGEESSSFIKKIPDVVDKIARTLHIDSFTGESINKFLHENRFTKYLTGDYKAFARNDLAKLDGLSLNQYSKDLAENLSKLKDNPNFSDKINLLSDSSKQYLQTINKDNASKEIKQLLAVSEELISKGVDKIESGGIMHGEVKLSTLRNQVKAASVGIGETTLGTLMAKGALKGRVITGHGSTLGLAFVALCFQQAYSAAQNAPEGEKISSFANTLAEGLIGLAIFEPATKLLYNIAGNKYRGMTKEARAALETLVKTTNSNEKITDEALKIAKMQKELLLKGVHQDEVAKLTGKTLQEATQMADRLKNTGKLDLKFWEKPFKFIGKFLGAGLDTLQRPVKFKIPVPQISPATVAKIENFANSFSNQTISKIVGKLGKFTIGTANFGTKIISGLSGFIHSLNFARPTFAGFFGGLSRVAIIFFILQPLLHKPLEKIVHKIFGEPKEHTEEKPLENDINNGSTNPNMWTELPESAEVNDKPSSTTQQNINNQPNQPNATTNIVNNTGVETDENSLYTPSILVDNSYLQQKEQQFQQDTSKMISEANNTIERISRLV